MKKIKNIQTYLFLLAIFLIATSCATIPIGLTSSTTPIQNREYEILGKGEGSDGSYQLHLIFPTPLGWSIGKPDIDAAIKEAIHNKNGDALINVRWYNKTYYWGFFSYHKFVITGDVIKFTTSSNKK